MLADAKKVAILISFSGDGGVEKMVCNLAQGFLDAGYQVDFILIKARGSHVSKIPAQANIINLNAKTALLALGPLVRYLRESPPAAMLVAKDRAGRVALLARRMARAPTRVVIRLGMHLSASLEGKSRLQKALRYYPIRRLYPWADGIVGVAEGVAEDIIEIAGLQRGKVHVLPNPTVTNELYELAAEPLADAWFMAPGEKRVLGVGRLTPQKGFLTLIKAFAELRAQMPARLLILGEGPQRRELEAEVRRLGLEASVRMPGFQPNPYSYMSRADLFVLSSVFEGSPNVLKEALALGTPSVATDCQSGPREILQDGRYGPLVPIGDSGALAQAMVEVLTSPPDRTALPDAVTGYTLAASTEAYLNVLGLPPSAANS